jgi:single-stranded DNA-binding protein
VVFNRVTLWGAQAQYWSPAGPGKLSKGDSVLVEGALADDNYVDKGGEKTFGRIKVDHVQTFNLVARHRDLETAVIDAGDPDEEVDNNLPVA